MRFAVAPPMPRAAPLRNATFPSNRFMPSPSASRRCADHPKAAMVEARREHALGGNMPPSLRRGWLIATAAMLALCLFALWQSLLLAMTDRLGPGPGFIPFWL